MSPALSTSATASAIQATARGMSRRFCTRLTRAGMIRPALRGRGDSVNDVDGRDIGAVGVLVVQAGDRFLRGVGGVVLAEEDAVLLGGRVGAERVGLVAVVRVGARPLDALARVQDDRVVAVPLEGGLIEALVLVEELAAGAVGVHAV